MERESVDGRDGDDERTENERSPPPPPPRSRPATRDQARKVQGERRSSRSRSRGNTPAKDERDIQEGNIVMNSSNNEERGRRRHVHKSRSALRDRDQTQSGLGADNPNNKSNEKDGLDNNHDARNGAEPENGVKRRRRFRLRNRNRNSRNPRKRNHHRDRQDRRYKPYTELSWEERKERDDQESQRAAMRRANRPTPYNTTQFLMEDHKVDTPDLSNARMQCDSSDEILEDDINGDYLERDFSAVYEEVQSERLESMSKEQLVNEVLALQRRVTELEEEQKNLRPSSAGESDHSSSGQQIDKGLRRRLESLSSLEGEVQRLRSENSRLRKASLKEPVAT